MPEALPVHDGALTGLCSLSFGLLCRFDLGIGHPGAACGTGDLRVMFRHLSQKDGECLTAFGADYINFLVVHLAPSVELAVRLL
jgi:hypothetical protein